ncbi:uncharacterized protein LOC102210863 [Pundamilia nyererei]|uniref:Uncharacterized protein LOC102210863 n=1 Tax=Pundamilia nyererei TaxID=303518 RepID=A0A9Y3RVW5_9CICH|nr:PREDICTED: uncharacterized protein LOC102210863 [Pundamilia nyererei]
MANCEQEKLRIVLIEKTETALSKKIKGILEKSFNLVMALTRDNGCVIVKEEELKDFESSIFSPGPHVFLLIYMGHLSPSSGDAERIQHIKEFFGEASTPYFLPLIIHKNATLDTKKKEDILFSIEKDLKLSRETYCAFCCKGGKVNENEINNLVVKIKEVVNKNKNKEIYTKEMFDEAQKSNSKGKTGDGDQGHSKNATDTAAKIREFFSFKDLPDFCAKMTIRAQKE